MITALHGFLGLPRDWDFLPFDVIAPPLDAIPQTGDTLLGYSMGGRLALRALINGATYQRAVIVSAGITVEPGRAERDEIWARRFETEEWSSLMQAWNAQPVFGGHALQRDEHDYDRAELARALREYSSGVLEPLATRLHEITIPVLWIVGALDAKYVAEAHHAIELLPNAELFLCEGAGHRVPWEQPAVFVDRLRAFLE
ncbi:MAG TPA: alpha/beta fold hydrolase [Thermoanaerobaculia bacterium]|nr:alpha/beta fold hydrolase [Thermoanaerobaculia bacterium]